MTFQLCFLIEALSTQSIGSHNTTRMRGLKAGQPKAWPPSPCEARLGLALRAAVSYDVKHSAV